MPIFPLFPFPLCVSCTIHSYSSKRSARPAVPGSVVVQAAETIVILSNNSTSSSPSPTVSFSSLFSSNPLKGRKNNVYSDAQRGQIANLIINYSMPAKEIAKKLNFEVKPNYIYNFKRSLKMEKSIEKKKAKGRRSPFTKKRENCFFRFKTIMQIGLIIG